MTKNIHLANYRGFCAGVDRAINIVEKALKIYGSPIYVRHEVVHNKFVVDNLRKKGVIFIENLIEVPKNSILIYSAHGVSIKVQKEAQKLGFKIFDATCPLVTKVHKEVQKMSKEGYTIIIIGHKEHPEVEGTMGQVENNNIFLVENTNDAMNLNIDPKIKLAYVSQTTLSIDETKEIINALKKKYPNIKSPSKDDICYATQNRQDAVKKLTTNCDIIIVVGSQNSSNSNRLFEVAKDKGIESYMIENANFLNKDWFKNKKNIGLTAGASAPEILIDEVIIKLNSWGFKTNKINSKIEEKIVFVLPKNLR